MLSKRFKNDHRAVLFLNKLQKAAKKQVEEKVQNKRYIFTQSPCCVCQNTLFELLSEKDGYGLYCPVVICKACGLIQQNPRMSQKSYDEFYDKEYRKLYSGEGGDRAIEQYFYYQWHIRGKKVYKYIEEKTKLHLQNKKVFEIGCSTGGILQYFQERGNKVFGIDLGQDYVAFGKEKYGLNLQVASLKDADISWKPDIVIYNNVIEHLLNPVEELRALRPVISKDTLKFPTQKASLTATAQIFYGFLRMLTPIILRSVAYRMFLKRPVMI